MIAQTEQELTNNKFMKFDKIEQTENEYVLYEGEYVLSSEAQAREAEKQKQEQIKELQAQLDTLDLKAIRALRAIQSGNGTQEDTAKLAELEQQAETIREQIKSIGEQNENNN